MGEVQVKESADREMTMSHGRDIAVRESVSASAPSRSYDGPRPPALHHESSGGAKPQHASNDTLVAALAQVQTQIAYSLNMLEQHRHQIQHMETAMTRFSQDMVNFADQLHDIRVELRARPTSSHDQPRIARDAGDLEVLASQIENVTKKVNDLDSMKMQLELMKNRLRRIEEHDSAVAANLASGASAGHRESSFSENPLPNGSRASHTLTHPPPPHPAAPASIHQPTITTQYEGQPSQPPPPPPPHNHASMSHIEAQQARTPYVPPPRDPRALPPGPPPPNTSPAAGYRQSDVLPPPSTLPGWRPAESAQHPGSLQAPPHPPSFQQSHSSQRPYAVEAASPRNSWDASNAGNPPKRPYEDQRQPSHEPVTTGSPKRPKLAPIMPRGQYLDESPYTPSATESSAQPQSSATSISPQTQNQGMLAPFSSNNFRITSTATAEPHEQPESDRYKPLHTHHHGHGHGHGRRHSHGGRGGRGGARGGRGRWREHGDYPHPLDTQDVPSPDGVRPAWTPIQAATNGFYDPHAHHRGPDGRGSYGVYPGREHEAMPGTPLMHGHQELFRLAPASGELQTTGGKRTRTKPIRNADGVLIRKDGRPDMRSVSSANNLRKVHAKKEAERGEGDGRPAFPVRELRPAHSGSPSDDEHGVGMQQGGTPSSAGTAAEPQHGDSEVHQLDAEDREEDVQMSEERREAQERHREYMSRMFPSDVDEPKVEKTEEDESAPRFNLRHHSHRPPNPLRSSRAERDGKRQHFSEMPVDSSPREIETEDVPMYEASEKASQQEESLSAPQQQEEDGDNIIAVAKESHRERIGASGGDPKGADIPTVAAAA